MTQKELIDAITAKFQTQKFIDLTSVSSITISGNAELEEFFLGDDEPIGEVLARGGASMRKGFYKVISEPVYRTDIFPNTFAADVLYFRDDIYPIIKFHANIGPLTNKCVHYHGAVDNTVKNIDVLFKQFYDDRLADTASNYFYRSKCKFYKRLYDQQKIFVVKSNEFSKKEGCLDFKEAHWMFMT